MAKKKEATKESMSLESELAALKAKLEAQEQTLEAFRTSFANIDAKFRTLIERNRLR